MINWHFVAHIIRDVFPPKRTPALIGNDGSCMLDFWSTEHFLQFISLSMDSYKKAEFSIDGFRPYSKWPVYDTNHKLDYNYSDLLLSINYDPELNYDIKHGGVDIDHVANSLMEFVNPKEPMVLVNPGRWASGLEDLDRMTDFEDELKRFSMFRDERVLVYENP